MRQSTRFLLLLAPVIALALMFTSPEPALPMVTNTACAARHESPTQLLFFYKPVENITTEWMAKNFDFFIFTKNDEETLAEVKTISDGEVLQYIKYDAVQDPCFQAKNPPGTPCNCDRNPLNNQVGWNAEDICWIRDNHPDWFLRGESGELLYFQYHVMMDPGNKGWRDFWLSRLESYHAQYPWDGIFIDNLGTRFGLHNADFVPLQRYENDRVYQDTVVGFFEDVRARYFDLAGKTIYANVSVYQNDLTTYLRYLDYLEGAMDEFWAYPREGYYSVSGWQSRLERMDETLKRGKKAFLISQGAWDDHERMRFGLASYLLIADENAYFRYTRQISYRRAWLYDDYKLPLGDPLGEYTTDGITWRRYFANGEVSVIPSQNEAALTVYDETGGCEG
jgi:hypothetical protein